MAAHQYRDLPQIPQGEGESRYASWALDSYSYTDSCRSDNVQFRSKEAVYFDEFDNGAVNMQPMERFMHDRYPLTHGVLHANIPVQRQPFMLYEQTWPNIDGFRNVSPDRTSATGSSSYELHSPNVFHAVPYGSPTCNFSQPSLLYPTAEHFGDVGYASQTALLGGSISLREIEYEHQEPEHDAVKDEPESVALKQEAVIEHDNIIVEVKTAAHNDSREYADSGIGNSVRGAESVEPMPMDLEELHEDPASDSDYSPASSNGRNRRRRRSSASNENSSRASTTQRGSRVSKSSSSSKVSKRTRRVSVVTKKRAEADDERRQFPCPLATYGCDSTFSSKNEWKRHVSTQHVKLGFWRCDLCPPSVDAKDDQAIYFNDFNRKDLFTQHLRRMHAAPKLESTHLRRDFPVNEDNLADHQTRCLLQLRKAPQHSVCLFCDKAFHGPTSWEERMEHIGRHLEKDGKGSIDVLDSSSWNRDEELELYLLDEGLIVNDQGGWKIGDGKRVRDHCDSDYESDD
ncbi:hypothetical protein DE146DRAFT_308394 [Phaeosphaeria sp. MPI-PUGE-AT-0046c]|nr:hypothetical protein DE146DRAFT_308394 [Phaeosphaeria sp. MPI-PUGE-AT-0046c]